MGSAYVVPSACAKSGVEALTKLLFHLDDYLTVSHFTGGKRN